LNKFDVATDHQQHFDSKHINLTHAIHYLASLVDHVIQMKEEKENTKLLMDDLKKKVTSLMVDKDKEVAAKNSLQMSLAQAKTDLMSVNTQLLEAIQQKLQQQREIEAWQEDMELMIQKNVNEQKMSHKSIRKPPAIPATSTRSSWFTFSRKNSLNRQQQVQMVDPVRPSSPAGSSSSSASCHERSESSGGLFTWLRSRKSNNETSSIHQPSDEDTKSLSSLHQQST